MSKLLEFIDKSRLPHHVAVIMDGNGRWAKKLGKPRIFGHKNGVQAVRNTSEAAAELGIDYLTLYAFSTENWNRPKFEVNALMTLLVETINKEITTLNENDIRLNAIGHLKGLPRKSYNSLIKAIENTKVKVDEEKVNIDSCITNRDLRSRSSATILFFLSPLVR